MNLAINGTASRGYDYLPLDNPVVIPNGRSSVTLTVIPFDDLHWEATNPGRSLSLVASKSISARPIKPR